MLNVLTSSNLNQKSFLMGLLWGALLFPSFSVFAQDWHDPQWLKLLRYNKSLFGYRSEADGKNFFLHPDGRTSPEKELKAFVKAISFGEGDVHCRFPARFRWIKKKHPEIATPITPCEKLDEFRGRLKAKSLFLVFSSYYLNNPASSFGHTFLRLGKNPRGQSDEKVQTELLDTGINYGAETGGANPVWFAIGGLAGFFPGSYSAIPYYYKVREYNDFESRDLWSYELNFTEEEILFVVDQVWELGHTYFEYYFLTENCSYHVMTLLEGARPSLNIVKDLTYLYVIPADTIRILNDHKLIETVKFRAAPSTIFYQQLKMLRPSEQKMMMSLYDGKKELNPELSRERRALIYDTALSLMDFKNAKAVLKGDEKIHAKKRPLLVGRSKILIRSPDLDFSDKMKEAPHKGHRSKRVALGYLNAKGKNKIDFEWRFAYHDLLDYSPAYPHRTKLEVGRTSFRIDGQNLQFREFQLLDILSLGKWDRFNRASAWKVKFGNYQTRYKNKELTTQGTSLGYGLSFHSRYFSPYLLAHGEASYISEELYKMKLAYGADAGVLMDFSNQWKIYSVFEIRINPWNESQWLNEIRYSTQEFAFGGHQRAFTINGDQEYGLNFYFYL